MYDCNRLSKMDKAGNYHSSTALEVGEMVFAAFFPIVSFGVYSPRKHTILVCRLVVYFISGMLSRLVSRGYFRSFLLCVACHLFCWKEGAQTLILKFS